MAMHDSAYRSLRRSTGPLLLVAAAFVLCGCGGGGGGSGAAATSAGPRIGLTPDALLTPSTPTTFFTTEFSTNLDQINAESAYARGATGAGVTVAIIDTGIDPLNTELAPNLSPASIDIVSSGPISDEDGHGTAVAGIVAAARDGNNIHGVAFEATLLGIRADERSGIEPASGSIVALMDERQPANFFDSDLVAAIDYAVANGAGVINLSLGGTRPGSAALRTAMRRAVASGALIFASTGNGGNDLPPLYPALAATDPTLSGLLIGVGSVDADNNISDFSQSCGAIQASCLVAPGEGIITTALDNQFSGFTGTSASAPHAAGAAALLLQAFPNLSASQVADILLESATDLGIEGTDALFGRGLLNLNTAAAPIGAPLVPVTAGSSGIVKALSDTTLGLSPPFGNPLTDIPRLSRALILDRYERPYIADLSQHVHVADGALDIEHLFDSSSRDDASVDLGLGLSANLTRTQGSQMPTTSPFSVSRLARTQHGNAANAMMQFRPDDNSALALGVNVSAMGLLPTVPRGTAGSPGLDSLGWDIQDLTSPHAAFLSTGNGASLSYGLGPRSAIQLSWFESHGDDEHARLDGNRAGQVALEHSFAGGTRLRVSASAVRESQAFLGSTGSGALNVASNTRSAFYTVGATVPLGHDVDLVASYTHARSRVGDGSYSLLSGFSTVEASAFGAGLTMRNLWRPGDSFGLVVGQPLRVDRASASLSVPIAIDLEGNVDFSTSRESLGARGREIQVQAAYQRTLGKVFRTGLWAFAQSEPGHDRDAAPNFGVAVRVNARFD